MTKLEGNERWKSKMLLTEHAELYEERRDPERRREPLTPEEFVLLEEFIILPHMLTMCQKSLDDLKHMEVTLKAYLQRTVEYLMNRVTQDLYQNRKELKRRGIRVTEDVELDMVLYYHVVCRGYEERYGIMREKARASMIRRLTGYACDIFEIKKNRA